MAARSYLLPVLLSALGTTVLGAAARPAWAGERDLYDRTVNLIQAHYLDVATLDGLAAWRGAAKSAEDAIPWLVTEGEGTQLILRHGATGPIGELSAPEGPLGSTLHLAAALDAMEDAIRAGGALPDDVDLPIELIRGLTRALDKHSTVLARSRLESFDERISGRLSGVGARMGTVKGRLVVKEAFPGGPADEAGLKAGDVVLRVDGHSTLGQSVNQVVRHIRGPVGTQVLLSIRRESGPQPEEFDLVLTREDVVIPNVTWRRRPSGVGVVTIDHFSEQTAMLLTQALVEMESGKAPLRGIVLDLRGNSGGSMIQACRSVDLFVESGVVLRTEGRDGERVDNLLREYRAHPEPNESTAPVVVLVDESSASAAEILAGSLSRLNRAVLIGQRTHGKGTVQKLYTVRGGGPEERARLKLTVARYKLPGDIGIEPGVGLPPDLLVRPITFSAEGVRYDPTDPGAGAVLDWVDERPGWRRGDNAPQDTRSGGLEPPGQQAPHAPLKEEPAGHKGAVDRPSLLGKHLLPHQPELNQGLLADRVRGLPGQGHGIGLARAPSGQQDGAFGFAETSDIFDHAPQKLPGRCEVLDRVVAHGVGQQRIGGRVDPAILEGRAETLGGLAPDAVLLEAVVLSGHLAPDDPEVGAAPLVILGPGSLCAGLFQAALHHPAPILLLVQGVPDSHLLNGPPAPPLQPVEELSLKVQGLQYGFDSGQDHLHSSPSRVVRLLIQKSGSGHPRPPSVHKSWPEIQAVALCQPESSVKVGERRPSWEPSPQVGARVQLASAVAPKTSQPGRDRPLGPETGPGIKGWEPCQARRGPACRAKRPHTLRFRPGRPIPKPARSRPESCWTRGTPTSTRVDEAETRRPMAGQSHARPSPCQRLSSASPRGRSDPRPRTSWVGSGGGGATG